MSREPHESAPAGGFRPGRAIAALGLLALAAWLGLRITEARRGQEAMANERLKVAREAAQAGPAVVTTVTGQPDRWRPEIPVEGTLEPIREADLGFKVGGRLSAVRVRVGDRVREGAVLGTLEQGEAQAQARAADAQARAAEAQLKLADDAAQRTSALVGTGAAPQASGVQVTQQRALAQAQLDAARAQRDLAQANLSSHVLTAPFTGTITRVPAGIGSIVGPGTPLFHLQDTASLKLQGTVAEADAALVQPGAPVAIDAGGRTVQGKVLSRLASVDRATRRVPIEAEVKNDEQQPLLGGAFVRARVVTPEEHAVLRVPATALRPGSQDELLVVEGGRLRVRRILFATAADGTLLVRRGLKAGESVVQSPVAEAKDGDEVATAPDTASVRAAAAAPAAPAKQAGPSPARAEARP